MERVGTEKGSDLSGRLGNLYNILDRLSGRMIHGRQRKIEPQTLAFRRSEAIASRPGSTRIFPSLVRLTATLFKPVGAGPSDARPIGSEHALMAWAVEFLPVRFPYRCAPKMRTGSRKSKQPPAVFGQPHTAFVVGKNIRLADRKRSESGGLFGNSLRSRPEPWRERPPRRK